MLPNGPRLSCGASAGGRKRPALRYALVGAQTYASRPPRQLQALVRQHLPSDESGYRAGRRQSVAAPTNATTAAATKTPTRMTASQAGPRNAAARTPSTNVKRPAATDTLTMRHQVSATGSDAWDLRRWRS